MKGYHCEGTIFVFNQITKSFKYYYGSFVLEAEGTKPGTYKFYSNTDEFCALNIVNEEGIINKFPDTEELYVCFTTVCEKIDVFKVVYMLLNHEKDMVSTLTKKLKMLNESIDVLYEILYVTSKEV